MAAGGVLAACLLALLASAFLDRPATTVTTSAIVSATPEEVWATLLDVEGYAEWNPVLRGGSNPTGEGDTFVVELDLPGHDAESLEPTVLIFRPDRKLRWQDRLLLPGVRDWEYEFVIEPLEAGSVVVVQRLRAEGLLSLFADEDAAREGLELMTEALVERLGGQSR